VTKPQWDGDRPPKPRFHYGYLNGEQIISNVGVRVQIDLDGTPIRREFCLYDVAKSEYRVLAVQCNARHSFNQIEV